MSQRMGGRPRQQHEIYSRIDQEMQPPHHGTPTRSPLYHSHRHTNSAGSSDGSGPRPHRRHHQHHSSGSSLEMEPREPLYGMSQYEAIGERLEHMACGVGGQMGIGGSPVASHGIPPGHHSPAHPGKVKELEEARQRISQMEKTMRWWSDCTNNWRDKWSKARAERNEAKEELRKIKTQQDTQSKELEAMISERATLEQEIINLRAELCRFKEACMEQRTPFEGAGGTNSVSRQSPSATGDDTQSSNNNNTNAIAEQLSIAPSGMKQRLDENESAMADLSLTDNQLLQNEPEPDGLLDSKLDSEASFEVMGGFASGGTDKPTTPVQNGRGSLSSNEKSFAEELLALNSSSQGCEDSRIAYLQLRLQDALRQLTNEKQENERLLKDLSTAASKSKPIEEVASHRSSMTDLTAIEDFETEERLQMLQLKLEKMQEENAAEWQRCEKLESEKASLERENKRLKIKILELEEMRPQSNQSAASTSSSSEGIGSMGNNGTQDLSCAAPSKGHQELKQAHSKLKKVLQEKTVELCHALRRADAFEAEVKKLRQRIDELKKQLANVQDELDVSNNSIRKLTNKNKDLDCLVKSLKQENSQLESTSLTDCGEGRADDSANLQSTSDESTGATEPTTSEIQLAEDTKKSEVQTAHSPVKDTSDTAYEEEASDQRDAEAEPQVPEEGTGESAGSDQPSDSQTEETLKPEAEQ